MHVVYQTSINSLRENEQDIVKAGWQQIGIETELKSVDASVFFSADAGNPDTNSHFYTDVEMYTSTFGSPDATPTIVRSMSTQPGWSLNPLTSLLRQPAATPW